MHRFYDFVRRHPTGVDSAWALVLLMASGAWIAASIAAPADARHGTGLADGPVQQIAAVPVALALSLVVALRRRVPEKMLLLTIAAGLTQLALDVNIFPGDFAMLVITYTVAAGHTPWASRLALAGAFVAPSVGNLRWPGRDASVTNLVVGSVFMTVPFVLAWVLGDSLRTRRAYYAQLEERAARLEKEREAQAKVAVAAERARIARELHDVVAHNVSVMVVQADGAAYVMDSAPEQARQALETISGTGRQALGEMRRLLGVLRSGEPAAAGEYVPQPGVEQLTDLVEQVRGTGLPVDFHIVGTPRPLPSSVELTAYRIVQEALTNTRKHGGPHVGAQVRLTYGDDRIDLLAEDDGRGAQQELYSGGGTDGLGQGLIGMRERVGMVGGELEAGPRPGGGFRISAVLPMKNAHS